ncbi:MAG: hypothetical protein JWR05_2471 [Mucilaginibacter sp.]|nr:hypothetical protein [Mucilaginibacter sp.]
MRLYSSQNQIDFLFIKRFYVLLLKSSQKYVVQKYCCYVKLLL